MSAVSAERAQHIAKKALATGLAHDSLARARGQLLDPIPIQSPAGEPGGWMVPVGIDDKLLGFIQLLPEGAFHRYSRFSRHEDSTSDLPEISEWVDSSVVIERVRQFLGLGWSVATPVLSFDKNIDRIAWLSKATSSEGEMKAVFVAGMAIWESPLVSTI